MSDNKKYYYLKLKDNFYNTEDVKLLESMPNGYEYSSLYLKLCLLSLKGEGQLLYKNRIPYKPEMLSTITGHSIEVINYIIPILQELEMLTVMDNGTIFIDDMQNLIGHGSTEAERKAEYRKKLKDIKLLGHCPDNRPPEKEKELKKEIDKDKKKEVKEKPEAKASPVDNDKEKRQALIDFFYRKYEELYDEKLVFDKKAIGCINNLIKHPMPEIEKRSEMLIKRCKDRKDTFHVFTPSMMLLKWNELVRKPSIYGK